MRKLEQAQHRPRRRKTWSNRRRPPRHGRAARRQPCVAAAPARRGGSLPPGRATAARRSAPVHCAAAACMSLLASGPASGPRSARLLRGCRSPLRPWPRQVPGDVSHPQLAHVTRQTPGTASHPQPAAGAGLTPTACRAPLLIIMPTYFSLLRLVNQWVIPHNLCVWVVHLIAHMSRDQPRAHEFTKNIGLPSPAPSWVSARARLCLYRALPDRVALRYLWGMVPVSPARTTGSFPKIEDIGKTYITSLPGSSS